MIKECEEKRNEDDTESDHDAEEEKPKPKKPAKKSKPKAPAKPRIKPSFYYVSSSEDEAGMLKDRFWKDLEDGKVDIFRTADLYSTVKAIGRSARPKSLAESDLRRSGLRSAFNQPIERDEAVEPDKGKSKGKKGRKGKAGSERCLRSITPKSRSGMVSVNLGVKVDHESSVGRGSKSSDNDDDDDDEEEVGMASVRSGGKAETELKSRKKTKKKKTKKKEKKKEDTEDEEEEEEEEEVETERPKKTKRKSLKVVGAKKKKKKRKDEQTEEESEAEEKEDDDEEEDEDEGESVKEKTGKDAAEAKKVKNIMKGNDRDDDDEGEEDNDNEADDNRKPRNREDAKPTKKSTAAGKDDEDDVGEDVGDDDVDDERKEEDRKDDDDGDDAEKSTQRMKRKADVPASKPNKKKKLELDEGKYEGDEEKGDACEEDESKETPPKKAPEKTIKPKVQGVESDPDVVRQHMLDAIDRVIAQSSAMWREGHGVEEGTHASEKEETLGDTSSRAGGVENPESAVMAPPKVKTGKKNKKRKDQEEDEEVDDDDVEVSRGAVSSKSWKPTDSVIDYYFSEEHEESESDDTVKKPVKKRSKVKNQAKTKKEKVKDSLETTSAERLDVTEARSVEGEPCGEKGPEEKEPDVLNDVKDETTCENEEQLKKDLSVSEASASSAATAAAEIVESGDHHPDQKEELESEEPADEDSVAADKEPAENSGVAVEDTSLDHLVFDLPTVESVDPSDETDSYAESNIKVLTNGDLYQAVKFNDFGVVEAMMREAYHFDLEQVDPQTGLTLTMVATQNYSMEIVELLVLSGANVNARSKDGHTALTLACDKGLHCAVSLLLCLGANIGYQLPAGETALILAVKKDHYHVARVLLEHGVNIGASAVGERHALSLARQLNYQPLVELLTTHKTRLTSELFQQVSMALEGSAKLGTLVFPIQCFRLCDGNRFRVDFRHELQPTQTSRGMLLFIGHGRGSASDMQVRLFGACAVTKAVLNNVALQSLNEDNFILTFCPLRDGHNQLEISTVPLTRNTYKVHLTVAAFVVTLV